LGNLSEPGTLKRFPGRPRTEHALYNMAAMMASVGAGFDIRISNSTALHPSIPGATDQAVLRGKQHESYIGQRRDAYFAAVRDSIIAPENSFDDSPTSDGRPLFNNSYQHNRASADLDSLSPIAAPLEQCAGFRSADSLASTTQSSDDVLLNGVMTNTPSATSRTSSPFQSSAGNLTGETSQSTSIDSEGIDCRRCRCQQQSSSGSSPALLESLPSAMSNPRSSNPRSLRRSRDSRRLRHGLRASDTGAVTPVSSGLPPVRPTTLNISGGNTTVGSGSRKPRLSKANQSASSSVEDTHQRSFPSPGSTPPHIEHPRLLLDIDLDGLVPAPDESSSPPLVSLSVVSPQPPQPHLSVAQLRQIYFDTQPPAVPPTERARNCLVTGYIRMNGGDAASVPTQI